MELWKKQTAVAFRKKVNPQITEEAHSDLVAREACTKHAGALPLRRHALGAYRTPSADRGIGVGGEFRASLSFAKLAFGLNLLEP